MDDRTSSETRIAVLFLSGEWLDALAAKLYETPVARITRAWRKAYMKMGLDRRSFLAGTALTATPLAATLPMPAIAQNTPIRIGLLTVKTGPLAQGGIQMEQGVALFLKDRNNKMAGRPVELITGDTGGNPAGTKTKAQELIERDQVDMIFGPLAAFELLAISDYVAAHKTPILSLAAAEDMTQRKPNPYFVRASATSAQNMHPLADYVAKELKYKTVITIVEDFAFGYEQMGGFQRVFEGDGGSVVKKLWPPLVTPDYTPYLAQLSGVDAVVQGFAGSNPLKFMKQYKDAGVTLPVLGGPTAGDDALLKSFGDEVIGMISASSYTSDLDSPSNKHFVEGMVRDYGGIPGLYAAGLYINGMVAEAALERLGGKTDDKEAMIKAMRGVSLTDSPRGPFHFDHLGNVVGTVYIRRLERKDGKLVQTTIKTYPNTSQFWTFDEKWFLEQPVYSRDYPPLKS
jgi:branched-chain amino acid transport system substrate-binding protein